SRAAGSAPAASRPCTAAARALRATSASSPSAATGSPAEWRPWSGWSAEPRMGTVAWISAASPGGGGPRLAPASVIAFTARASWIPALISFAIGALLGAVFLDILPHAFAQAEQQHSVAATILAGILGFFVLEKLVLWRHCHVEDCEAHDRHQAQN